MFSSKRVTLRGLLLVSAICVGSAAWAAEWRPLLPEQLNWIESPAYPGVTFAVLAGGMDKIPRRDMGASGTMSLE